MYNFVKTKKYKGIKTPPPLKKRKKREDLKRYVSIEVLINKSTSYGDTSTKLIHSMCISRDPNKS